MKWALVQYDWCPEKMRTQIHIEEEGYMKMQEEDSH